MTERQPNDEVEQYVPTLPEMWAATFFLPGASAGWQLEQSPDASPAIPESTD